MFISSSVQAPLVLREVCPGTMRGGGLGNPRLSSLIIWDALGQRVDLVIVEIAGKPVEWPCRILSGQRGIVHQVHQLGLARPVLCMSLSHIWAN
jgi:hypothetical protein